MWKKIRGWLYDITLHQLDFKKMTQTKHIGLDDYYKQVFICIVEDGSSYEMVSFLSNRVYSTWIHENGNRENM